LARRALWNESLALWAAEPSRCTCPGPQYGFPRFNASAAAPAAELGHEARGVAGDAHMRSVVRALPGRSPMFRNRIVVFACTLALTGLTATARADVILFDDFNDGNDDGWTRYSPLAPFGAPGTFSFPSGGYRIQAAPSPDLAALGPGRAGSARPEIDLA